MAACNLNLGKASGGVLNIQPADGTTTTSLVLPAINGTVVAADSNGNVGIGTNTPLAKVDITQSGNNTTNGLNLRSPLIGADGTTQFNINTISSDANNWAVLNMKANNFAWSLKGTGTAMALDPSGNVGIGTIPTRKFEVYGSVPSIKISDSNAKSEVQGSIAKLEFAQHYGTITSSSIEGYQDGTATDY